MLNIMILALFMLGPVQATSLPNHPNVDGWKVVYQKQIEFKVNDYVVGFVGFITEYQNPEDSNEFVQVFSRQVVLLSERPKEDVFDPSKSLSSLTTGAISNKHQKEETGALANVQKITDAFAYIRWHVSSDERTKLDVLDGQMEFWLLDQTGNFAYQIQSERGAITRTLLTEPSGFNDSESLIVGLKFSLGDTVHILRVDQDDLKLVLNKEDKEKNNVK